MASTRLTRTASSGSNTKYTASCWVKRNGLAESTTILSTGDTSADNNARMLFLSSSDSVQISYYNAGFTYQVETNALLRDVSAWYHLVAAVDTTQATASNRVKIYINGVLQTSFSTASYPSQNATFNYNSATQYIGDLGGRAIYSNFCLANLYYIDGTQLDATSFGQTDSTTGIWKPKGYSGSYGTNGFFLKFENSGSLGTDSSGNGNNFTVNGTPTQTVDTPSNVFATMNPLYQSVFGGTSAILTNGNTKWTGTSNGTSQNATLGTLGVSTGKWYWEVKGNMIYDYLLGIAKSNFDPNGGTGGLQNSGWWGLVTNISATGGAGLRFVVDNTHGSSTGTTLANGDIINIALDATNLKFYIGKNGTWLNSGVPTSGATGTGSIATLPTDTTFLPACSNYGYSSANSWEFNFGNGRFGTTAISSPYSDGAGLGKFQYQPPTGYYALCTKNINIYG